MALSENGIKLLDIAVKGIAGALIAALVTIYGSKIQDSRQRAADENKSLQAAIELTSKQKDLDVDLGMRMFGTLMGYYFQRDKSIGKGESVRQQMLLLRLISLNFQDVPIHLRPLFDELNGQLTTEEEKAALQSVALEVAHRQAFRLTIPQGREGGVDSGVKRVRANDEINFPSLLTRVHINKIGPDWVQATIVSDIARGEPIGPFKVSYFDIPIVDNTRLGDYRFSLILRKTDGQEAEVRFIAFPSYLAADRFDIKGLSRAYRDRLD